MSYRYTTCFIHHIEPREWRRSERKEKNEEDDKGEKFPLAVKLCLHVKWFRMAHTKDEEKNHEQ